MSGYKSLLDFFKAISINIITILIPFIPDFIGNAISSFLGFFSFIFLKGRRRAVLETLRVVRPDSTRYSLIKLGFNTLVYYARNFGDFLRLYHMSSRELVNQTQTRGVELISNVLSLKKGVIVVTAHIGNWEVGSNFFAALDFPIAGVAESAGPGDTFYKLFKRYREHFGMEIISLEDPSIMFKLRKYLRKGFLIGLIGDRDISGTGIEVEFFGKKARFPQGPAFLSLATGSPIVTTFFLRNTGGSRKKYIVYVEGVIDFTKGKNRREDIKNLTQMIAVRIEKIIRDYPDQWFSFPPPWKF